MIHRLPKKIVNKYKENVPRVVSVDGPYGPAFQVELTPSEGEICLDKGFEQFMDYFSIKPGYLLVFKCDIETPFFHVKIFDRGATQIDYPSTSVIRKNPENVSNKPCCMRDEIEVVSGKCMECLYDMLAEVSRKRKTSKGKKLEELHDDVSVEMLEKNPTLDAISRKGDISNRKKLVEDDVAIEVLEEDNDSEVSGHFMYGISSKRQNENLEKSITWQKRKKTVSIMNHAHERAKAFRSTRPSFVSYMRPSYISNSLYIKKTFAMKFFKGKHFCDVVLMVNGCTRTWTAKCYLRSNDANLRWRKFVKDNGLREGDACVFELRNGIKPSLNVIIFRSSEDEVVKGNLRNTDIGEISRKRKISKGDKLEELPDDAEVQILEKNITLDNKMKKLEEVEDDVSIDNLEEHNDYEVSGGFMNVNFRKRQKKKMKTWQKRKQTNPAHERAKAYRSSRPSFVSFMHHSYISQSLHIKKSFAKKFFKIKRFCDVVLMVNGGTRTWTAKCHLGTSNAKLRWKTFVKDNGLCEGDSWVFELGNNIIPSLNVIIFRSSEDEEVKGNLRNTDVGEIPRKRKISKGKKLEEHNDYEVSGDFMNDILRKRQKEKMKTWQKHKQTVSYINLAHKRAKAFRSTRPSFVSFMHRTYISHRLNMSKSFVTKFFKIKRFCDVVLMVNGGTRTWTAKCSLNTSNAKLGWKTFVKDNGLREGDSCVFELGNTIKPSLNVIIFRSSEDEENKGNLRNTDVGECSRKRKISAGKKFEEVDDDVSMEILEKGNDYEVSAHFTNDISAENSARKMRKKDIIEEKEEGSGDESEERKDSMIDNKEEKNEEYEDGSNLEWMKKASAANVIKKEVTQKSPPSSSKDKEDKDEGKNASAKNINSVKEKAQPIGDKSEPNDDELRDAIGDILKKVDFNTATFSGILKELTKRFHTNLAPRKSCIKLMIRDELNKLADEANDSDDEGED